MFRVFLFSSLIAAILIMIYLIKKSYIKQAVRHRKSLDYYKDQNKTFRELMYDLGLSAIITIFISCMFF
jgi:hypothetical protein